MRRSDSDYTSRTLVHGDKLKDLIDRAIRRVDHLLFKQCRTLWRENEQRNPIRSWVCQKAKDRDDCVRLVLGEESAINSPQVQLERFFYGLGSLFRQRRPNREIPYPGANFVSAVAVGLNSITSEIELHLRDICDSRVGQELCSTKSLREKLLLDLLGETALNWGIIPTEYCFAILPLEAYPILDSDNGEMEKPETTDLDTDSDIEDQTLRQRLISTERKLAESAAAIVDAQRRELQALQTIAELQQKVAGLTHAVCELRAENLGFRAQLQKDRFPSEEPLECLSESECYPVGQGVDPLRWLEDNYGHRLTHFGAPENTLFQDQLRRLDPGLFRAIENKINYENRKKCGAGVSLREIIPTKADRNTQKLAVALVGFENFPALLHTAKYRASRSKSKQR